MIILVLNSLDSNENTAQIFGEKLREKGYDNIILRVRNTTRPLEIFSLSNLPEVDVKYIENLVRDGNRNDYQKRKWFRRFLGQSKS